MSQTGQCAVGRRMGITTDHGHTGHGGAQFRTHHMNNALPHLIDLVLLNTVEIAVIVQGLHLDTGNLVGHTGNTGGTLRLIGGDIVIRRGNIGIQPPGFAIRQTQALKGLG